jgi:hypothetical protein
MAASPEVRGDARDWLAIRAWASGIGQELTGAAGRADSGRTA